MNDDGVITLLKPMECGTRLRELIERARQELWLVSPFTDLNEIENLHRVILKRATEGTRVYLVVSDLPEQRRALKAYGPPLERAGARFFTLKKLHAKIYWSEQEAILTSLNLRGGSFTSSVEIGLLIPKGDLHGQIRAFVASEVVYHAQRIDALADLG